MAANPDKQAAVGLHYLTGRFVKLPSSLHSIYGCNLTHGSFSVASCPCLFCFEILILGLYIQINFQLSSLLSGTTDAFENLTMVILSSLLVSGPNSPFYQSLIEPNIGSDYCAGVGWEQFMQYCLTMPSSIICSTLILFQWSILVLVFGFSYSYDNGTRDASFSIGLQGIKKADYPMVVESIHKTFDRVIE